MTRFDRSRRRWALVGLLILLPSTVACSKEPAASAEDTSAAASAAAPSAVATPVTTTGPAAAPAAATASAPGAPAAADPQRILQPGDIPDVVARIDGEAVSKKDLLARATEARAAIVERGLPQPAPSWAFFRGVLDDIIGNRLLHAALAAEGKAAEKADIDAQVAALESQYPSPEAFDQALAGRAFDRARLRADIEEAITVKGWVDREVVPSLAVTEAEARSFYEENRERMVNPEAVRARHVLIAVPQDATDAVRAEKRRAIDAARARIAGGEAFDAVAKEISEDPASARRGGELGWFPRGRLVPEFERAAFALPVGQLSDVVTTPFGFHVLEVAEKRARREIPFEEARPNIEGLLKQRQLETKVRGRINELASKAEIEVLF